MNKFIACIALGALFSGAAQAHYLWIEPDEAGARLYFGEAEVQLKEKSPGKLDSIKGLQAFAVDASGKRSAAPVGRGGNHFAIGAATAGTWLASEESLEVRDLSKHKLGIAKPNYYARFGQPAADAATALALDVQAAGPDTFIVLYRGQPLKAAKLEVIAPNIWMQEHTTDANGAARINAPWRGRYVLHVLHVDHTPGEHGGRQYDNLRSHFAYTFDKADGADPGPAVPPQHPTE